MDIRKEDISKSNDPVYWILFLRQLFSCSAIVSNFFMIGLCLGAPTVMIPQLRKEANFTDVLTPEITSWLSSILPYSAAPWTFILPLIAFRFGRKVVQILVTLNSLVGSILFYYSKSLTHLIISQVILGILSASTTTITIMVVSEYTSPKYRGVLLTVKSATFFWGVWVANSIGTFFYWRNISIAVIICSIYNLSSIFFCESPYWLAIKGRFDECAKVHRWLKGTKKDSEEELSKLILSQKEHLNIKATLKCQPQNSKITKVLNILRYKGFYRSLIYATLPLGLYNFSGKIACTVYAIEIIKKVTSSEKIAYNGMLILDGVTILGMYLGCAASKIVTRRKQLIILSSVGICFLYVLSVYLYMINLNIISENMYVSLILLTGFSLSISCGPMILASSCSAELSPLRYRSYFLCCLSLLSNTILATVLKISPYIFNYFDTHGAFLFYAISASFLTFLLYKYLPETKDKTIQEVEEYISKGDSHVTVKIELLQLKSQSVCSNDNEE